MEDSTQSSDHATSGAFRSQMNAAARFWEPRRLFYNLVLCAVVLAWIFLTWPHFRPAITWFSLFQLSVLGLLANLCYSAAYLVDIPMQHSGLATAGNRWRWILWTVGTLFAFVLANYWIADEIYVDFVG